MTRQITKFFTSLSGLIEPKSVFSDLALKSIDGPYAILTGLGIRAEVWEPHECNCEFCDHEDGIQQERNFLSEKQLQDFIDDESLEEDVKILGEIFWAKAVKQESPEDFELRSK